MYCFGIFLPPNQKIANSPLCIIQALGLNFACMANLFWITCIPINCFVIYKLTIINFFERYVGYFKFVCFGVPLIYLIVLLVMNSLNGGNIIQDVKVWCWIGAAYSELRFFLFYFWLIASLLIFLVLFCGILYEVKGHRLSWFLFVKFALYMGAMILTNSLGVINRVHDSFSPPSDILNALQVATSPLQGFLMAIIFYYIKKRDNDEKQPLLLPVVK